VAAKTTAESSVITRLKTKLKSVVDAGIVAMVTQGVTEERKAEFRQSLKENGYEEYCRVYQQIHDRRKEK
jgi:putative aldouronate transport system substrate-binding protein